MLSMRSLYMFMIGINSISMIFENKHCRQSSNTIYSDIS
jgi:hypothetical protein